MAAPAQAPFVRRLGAGLALLPVRLDDPRFWPRALLGLGLRWLVLQGSWWPLRDGLTWAVLHTTGAAGLPVRLGERAMLLLGAQPITVSVACTHVELLALAAPLLWDRTRSTPRNLGRVVLFAGTLALAGLVRIDLAFGLFRLGLPWLWAHDVPLGVFYFVVLALVLRAGAWTRPPRVPARAPRAHPPAADEAPPPPDAGSA
jgi:hypothetical protein